MLLIVPLQCKETARKYQENFFTQKTRSAGVMFLSDPSLNLRRFLPSHTGFPLTARARILNLYTRKKYGLCQSKYP